MKKTGFNMDNKSPECIAKNVIRALEHSNVEKIVKNARKLIEEMYTCEAAVERYMKLMGEL
jgi:glycosyltransferase involved in cell wall biosynthesis